MTTARSALVVSGLVSMLIAAGACTPLRMAVPADMPPVSDEIPISNRSGATGLFVNESFQMGPYQVVDVDRKWNHSSGSSFMGLSAENAKSGYSFGLRGPEGAYKGTCASQASEHSVAALGGMFGGQNFSVLCECTGPRHPSFVMTADNSSRYHGNMTANNANYAIEGIYEASNGSSMSRPLGYQVRGPVPVGAVEVNGKGRVWLNRAMDPGTRGDVACLFAGLLLYQEPKTASDR